MIVNKSHESGGLGISIKEQKYIFIKQRIIYKDEHLRIILKIVGLFDFPILVFEWSLINVGVHPNGGLSI